MFALNNNLYDRRKSFLERCAKKRCCFCEKYMFNKCQDPQYPEGKLLIELGDVYTVSEASRMLGVSEKTVHSWILQNKINYVYIQGIRSIPKEEVARKLEEEK